MKTVLRFAAKALAGLFAAVLLVAVVVLMVPSAVLNSASLSYALKRFGGGFRPAWSDLSLRVRSSGILTKRIVLSARELCFDEERGLVTGCLSTLELDATVRLGLGPLVSVHRVERLIVHAGDVRVDLTAAPAASEKKTGAGLAGRIDMTGMTLGTLEVRAPRVVVVSTAGATTAGATAGFRSDREDPMTIQGHAVIDRAGAGRRRFDADLTLDTSWLRDEEPLSSLDATLNVRGAGMKAEVRANLEPGPDGAVQGSLEASLTDPERGIRRAALDDCRLEATFSRIRRPERAELDCRLSLRLARFSPRVRVTPRELNGTASLRMKLQPRLGRADKAETRFTANLSPAKGYGGLVVDLEAEFAGTERHASAKASITRFAEIVLLLEGTPFAVPAPLNALDGKVDGSAEVSGIGEGRDVEFQARTDLTSSKQALKVSTKGTVLLRPESKPQLDAKIDLERVVLELPHLQLKGVPSPLPDKRIKTGRATDPEAVTGGTPGGAPFGYDVSVKTSTPALLRSNLIDAPVPLTLALRLRPEGVGGTARVESFPFEILRQKARVEHITLALRPRGAATGLDGRMVYKRAGAVVDIILLGTTAKPTVLFESAPPMTRDEVVALILYGKRPDELDVDQKSTAGNAATAMMNGGLGLASLFLFASTPIDLVGYDSATQSYQVRFKLPGNATLAVGSDMRESRTMSLRKRLAPHWELQSELSDDTGSSGAIQTFLQWFKSY